MYIPKSLSLLAITATLFLSACTQKNSNSNSDGHLDPAAISGSGETCEQFIQHLPSTYYYGWLSVPENYEKPEQSPLIKVFYYGPKGDFKDHVVFYNGGPGADSHYNFQLFDKAFDKFELDKTKVGFVYIDQRGNGCSSPYPNVESQTVDQDILRLRFYGSTGIVYDSEAVRKFLFGDKKWKVFGQSYGAYVVHRYAALFPNSILGAYAHANTINSNGMDRLTERIFSQYKVMEMYLQQYPEDRARIQALYNYLSDENLCYRDVKYGDQLCGLEVVEGLVPYLGFSYRWERLNLRLKAIIPNVTAQPIQIDANALQTLINGLGSPIPEGNGHRYAMSVLAYDDRNVAVTDYNNCSVVYKNIATKYGITSDKMILNECLSSMQYQFPSKRYDKVVSVFQASGLPHGWLTIDQFAQGLKKLRPDQFYLYSGERDTFVPKVNFAEELGVVQNLLTYFHFMGTGHEGFYAEKQVLEDLLKDLN